MLSSELVASALDVQGAISGSAAGGLARGLILAGLFVVLNVGIYSIVAKWRKGPDASRSSQPKHLSALPLNVVLASASTVGVIGSLVGALATWTNKSILVGGDAVNFFTQGLGAWSLASLVFFATVIVLSIGVKKPRSAESALAVSTVVLASSLIAGLVLTDELTRPAGWVSTKGTFNDSVTATAVVTPGAQGLNSVTVDLSGPDSEVEPIRKQVRAGLATATLVSLEQDFKSTPVKVSLSDQGGLLVDEIVADAPGRWRLQIDLGDGGDLLMLDVTLAPNPAQSR